MKIDFDSTGPVIIQFPQYAGGKFISNCLALSRHSVPQDAAMAQYLVENPADYEYRIDRVMDTLPTQSDMTNWIGTYELGDNELFGPAHLQWRKGDPDEANCNPITRQLSHSPLKFFIVCHPVEQLINLLKVWTRAQVVVLKNYERFRSIAHELKSGVNTDLHERDGNYCKTKYDLLAGLDWPLWHEFESVGFNINKLVGYPTDICEEIAQFYLWNQIREPVILFDIDSNIFDRDRFLHSMENLYQNLGFDDFDPARVGQFWQKYIDLHQTI